MASTGVRPNRVQAMFMAIRRRRWGRARVDVGETAMGTPALRKAAIGGSLVSLREIESGGQQGGDHATVGQRLDPS